MKFIKLIILFVATLFIGLSSFADVWTDVNSWSPEWEKKYSEWVEQNWQVDVFSRNSLPNGQVNPYKGLHVDCADTVYSMRIIYAFENKLPVAFHDPSGGTSLITNKMSRWNSNAREIERFRSFLNYIYETTSTRSLPDDTYPVALNRQAVRAGGLMMTVERNHHSWSLKEILPIGVPWLVFNSTVGAGHSTDLQQRQSWPNPGWVFEGNQTVAGNGGFRDWRQASSIGKPVWEVPGYSDEQYRIPIENWVNVAQKRLATINENDQKKIERLLDTVCTGFTSRVQLVNDAIADFQAHGGKCMDPDRFENFSTPNRDERVFDDLMSLRSAYKEIIQINNARDLTEESKLALNKIFPLIAETTKSEAQKMQPQQITGQSVCKITYAANKTIDLAEAKRRLFLGFISNNPNESLAARWGERQLSIQAQICPVYDTWAPFLGQN